MLLRRWAQNKKQITDNLRDGRNVPISKAALGLSTKNGCKLLCRFFHGQDVTRLIV